MKRSNAPPQSLQGAVGLGSAPTRQQSPRSRRPSSSGNSNSVFSSTGLRPGGSASAFGPPRRGELEIDEEQEATNRDLAFLNAAENSASSSVKTTHHNRVGSDAEFDTMIQLVPGSNRGTSPGVSQNTRPSLVTMRHYSGGPIAHAMPLTQQQAPQQQQQLSETPVTMSQTPEPTLASSRSNSPANFRSNSPTTGSRQPTSPQLIATRAPSPTISGSAPYRPQSPPQIASMSGIRPRSQSLDSKGVVAQPLPARPGISTTRPITAASGTLVYASVATQGTSSPYTIGSGGLHLGPSAVTSTAGLKTVKPGPMTISNRGGPSPIQSSSGVATSMKSGASSVISAPQQPQQQSWSTNRGISSTFTSRESAGNLHSHSVTPSSFTSTSGGTTSSTTNSPVTTFSQLAPELLQALVTGDATGLTDDQMETLEKTISSFKEQRRRPVSQTGTIASQDGHQQPRVGRHRPKEDSLEEVSHLMQMDDPVFLRELRQRGNSQDTGRLAPNNKMFESQNAGEETKGSERSRHPSPNHWYVNPPANNVRAEACIKTQPRIPAPANLDLSHNTPDLSRSVEITSGPSAFTASSVSGGESEDEVKWEDPLSQ